MNAHQAIQLSIEMGSFVAMGYVADLTDEELLHRPGNGCNHINWQLGHLICSEHELVDQLKPGCMPPLPGGFVDKYNSNTAGVDNPQQLCSKAELLETYQSQRAGTLALFDTLSDADFDRSTGIEYAPTVGAVFALQGNHWLMHAGQWAVVRRQLGRQPLY